MLNSLLNYTNGDKVMAAILLSCALVMLVLIVIVGFAIKEGVETAACFREHPVRITKKYTTDAHTENQTNIHMQPIMNGNGGISYATMPISRKVAVPAQKWFTLSACGRTYRATVSNEDWASYSVGDQFNCVHEEGCKRYAY